MENKKKVSSRKQRIFKHMRKVAMTTVFLIFTPLAGQASEAGEVLGTEGGKEALNQAVKAAGSKPAISVAAGIVCIACLPVAGAAASPAMCIACGILIAKTLG